MLDATQVLRPIPKPRDALICSLRVPLLLLMLHFIFILGTAIIHIDAPNACRSAISPCSYTPAPILFYFRQQDARLQSFSLATARFVFVPASHGMYFRRVAAFSSNIPPAASRHAVSMHTHHPSIFQRHICSAHLAAFARFMGFENI